MGVAQSNKNEDYGDLLWYGDLIEEMAGGKYGQVIMKSITLVITQTTWGIKC